MRYLVTYRPTSEGTKIRESVECSTMEINPNGHFVFIDLSKGPVEGTAKGELVLSVAFDDVLRVERQSDGAEIPYTDPFLIPQPVRSTLWGGQGDSNTACNEEGR